MPSPTLVVLKIYPEEIDSVAGIEAGLKTLKEGEVREIKREPIAFGLELVRVAIILPPGEDSMEKLEMAIKKIPGVNQMEVEAMTLL